MIRILDLSDVVQVYEIENLIFNGEAYSLNQITSELTLNNRIYLGCFKENKLVAYLGVMLVDSADVIKIGVLKAFRKQGIATELFNTMFKILKEKNINEIMLEVNEKNVSAIKLYENLGFKQIAIRKNYYGNLSAKIYKLDI